MDNQKTSRSRDLIRFDWAIKRLLRNKANYVVLEGFLSVLLGERIHIQSINEGEGNRTDAEDKFNRVDMLVENDRKELFIIEVQNSHEADYFLRMLYGVSKAVTDHIQKGEPYMKVRKVYHVNIVYFELGQGKDYVYHGRNEFYGIHHHDLLQLTPDQRSLFGTKEVSDLFPEYYVLRVEDFDNVAKDSLDEWIYYLKNNAIPEEFTAPGLSEARERLLVDMLPEQEKYAYYHHLEQTLYEDNAIHSAIRRGEIAGRKQGEAERRKLKAELKKEQAERKKEQAELKKEQTERKKEQLEHRKLAEEHKKLDTERRKLEAAHSEQIRTILLKGVEAGMTLDMLRTLTGLSDEDVQRILKTNHSQ
ncbi:MAG: PD-(D/E)XK nuclease family transposase [Tannerella sp.]|jgi:predicted transposase/invertase (TIGR01784 family)|nr:PD-(D/E)XK nuclease family transposase [Tannerella sp.]